MLFSRCVVLQDEKLKFTVMGGKEIGFGIFISDVEVDSNAEKIGLKRGDEILGL